MSQLTERYVSTTSLTSSACANRGGDGKCARFQLTINSFTIMKRILLSIVFVSNYCLADTAETVFTLSDDMHTATKYFSMRLDNIGNPGFLFEKSFNKDKISYARPSNYRWENSRDKNNKINELRLSFPNTASYAYLQRMENHIDDFIAKDNENKNRYYLLIDGSECRGENCQQDESIISAIIPKRLKVINYKAKINGQWQDWQSGEWKIVENTYTFYRKNLKGASIFFLLEDAASHGYTKLSEAFKQNKDIEVSNEGNRIRVVMPLDNLFASGSANMEKSGVNWLSTLQENIKDINYIELRVEGHTDSAPINKKTAQGYSSNWDLSAARSSNIVRFLIGKGLPADKIAAVGYADTRPIGNNDTPAGKAKNRRVEFSIITQEKATDTVAQQ